MSNPGYPKLTGYKLPPLRSPVLGLTEWEVLATFSCHQLGECDLTATRPDSPGRHLDGAVASGARLAFLGPPHHMAFLEWPLRSALSQPSLPSGPAWGSDWFESSFTAYQLWGPTDSPTFLFSKMGPYPPTPQGCYEDHRTPSCPHSTPVSKS